MNSISKRKNNNTEICQSNVSKGAVVWNGRTDLLIKTMSVGGRRNPTHHRFSFISFFSPKPLTMPTSIWHTKNLFQTKDRPTSFSHYLVNYCFLCDPIGWSFRQARIPRSALSGKASLWILKTKIRKKLGTNNCNMLIQQQKAIFKENTVVEKENQVGF